MSAGTQAFSQDTSLQNRENMRAGYTRISAGSMHQLAAAIAAEAFKVPLREVRAGVRDGQGQVSVSLAVPLALGAGELVGNDGGALFGWAQSARAVVARRLHELAGTTVGRVDIRFTGLKGGTQANAGRVQ
jgi:hypothetical protein